ALPISAYGGNIVSVIMGRTTPQLATVRPRMFEPLEPRDAQAEVRQIDVGALPEGPTRVLERSETDPRPRRLDEADLVVAVGADVDPTALEDAAAGHGRRRPRGRLARARAGLAWRPGLENPRAERARDQLDRELRGLVLVVEDRVHLDDLERACEARLSHELHRQVRLAVGETA